MGSKEYDGANAKPKTLKQWLADEIRGKILSGEYRPGELLDSERELCRKHKISRITVRATLDALEKDGLVRRYPRQGVLVEGKESSEARQAAKQARSQRIVYISNALNLTRYFADGVKQFCQEKKLDFLLLDAGKSNENFLGYVEYPPEDVGGVIFTPFWMPEYHNAIRSLVDRGVHVLCLDRTLDGVDVSSITVDNYVGGYKATSHLIKQWDRPVYHIGYRRYPSSAGQRYEGWRSAMEDHGFHDFEGEYLLKLMHREEENGTTPQRKYGDYGYEIAKELFANTKTTNAEGWSIFTLNDTTAMGVYRAAEEMGLQIGQDVAVVGFDDLPLAKRVSPSLTSVHGPRKSLGYNGAKLLYQEMKNPKSRPIHQVLPVELMIRESSVPSVQTAGLAETAK